MRAPKRTLSDNQMELGGPPQATDNSSDNNPSSELLNNEFLCFIANSKRKGPTTKWINNLVRSTLKQFNPKEVERGKQLLWESYKNNLKTELQPRYYTRTASFQNVRDVIHAIENLKIDDSSDFQTPPEPKTIEPHPTKKAREDHPCPKCGSFKGKKDTNQMCPM